MDAEREYEANAMMPSELRPELRHLLRMKLSLSLSQRRGMQILSNSSFVLVSCAPTIPASAASLFVSHLLFCDGQTKNGQAEGRGWRDVHPSISPPPCFCAFLSSRILSLSLALLCPLLPWCSPCARSLRRRNSVVPRHEESGNCSV